MTASNPSQNTSPSLILDMDGTLMKGDQPLPGLAQFFSFLNQYHFPFLIVTNNATHSPQDYQAKLAQCEVRVGIDKVLTTAMVTASKLQSQYPAETAIYVIGQPALISAVKKAGFRILSGSAETTAAVVVGGDPQLTYEKLKHATLHIQRGAHFIGTNPDVVYPTQEGLVPECGTTLAALQAATGVAPLIIGKPASPLFEQAMIHLATAPKDTVVVGDRLETDILGGQQAGCKTILITTGVDQAAFVKEKAIYPDHIVKSLLELTTLLHGMR